MSYDVPQADRLDLVRRVLACLAQGLEDIAHIASESRIAPRYVRYAIHSCRILDVIDEGRNLRPLGVSLLATVQESASERRMFLQCIRDSPRTNLFRDIILNDEALSRDDVAALLIRTTSMSFSTAVRRAQTVLNWRKTLREPSTEQLNFETMRSPARPAAATIPIDIPDAVELADIAEKPESSHNTDGRTNPPSIQLPMNTSVKPSGTTHSRSTSSYMTDQELSFFRASAAKGKLLLFTGAGFSFDAEDLNGRAVPLGDKFRNELWALCYPDDPEPDDSSIQDLFERAMQRHKKDLKTLLQTRFTVNGRNLPPYYADWFRFPWRTIYTLNVDNLAEVVDQQNDLPRSIWPISGLSQGDPAPGKLNIVHLNGRACDGVDGVTFSGAQFSERLGRDERHYAKFESEMASYPVIFVGTPIDEPVFWRYVELRRGRLRGAPEMRPKSFLISPDLSRARADRLAEFNIRWLKTTARAFTDTLRSVSAQEGLEALSRATEEEQGSSNNIRFVSHLLRTDRGRSEFYMGASASWGDIQSSRAVLRTGDKERASEAISLLRNPNDSKSSVPVVVLSGTAGAGTTTALMQLALVMQNRSLETAWIGAHDEVSPRALVRYFRKPSHPDVLFFDDASRFGTRLASNILDVSHSDHLRLIVLGMRSTKEPLMEGPAAEGLTIHKWTVGSLTDSDIEGMVDALTREKRLGSLRGLSRSRQVDAFKGIAKRQILAAMIEATSGEKFEDRVIDEWARLDKKKRFIYALVSLATTHSYPMSRAEVLLGANAVGDLQELQRTLDELARAHLLVRDRAGRFLSRHRVIAETLMTELTGRAVQIKDIIVGLCLALSIGVQNERPNSRRKRALRGLLDHEKLSRLTLDVEAARGVFSKLQEPLNQEHHFWLQRGCLELDHGSMRFAENYLDQAMSMEPNDARVQNSYSHMQLRKAIIAPGAPNAEKMVNDAFDALRMNLAASNNADVYAAHIFGSQAIMWGPNLSKRKHKALLEQARYIVQAAYRERPRSGSLRSLLQKLQREERIPRGSQ